MPKNCVILLIIGILFNSFCIDIIEIKGIIIAIENDSKNTINN